MDYVKPADVAATMMNTGRAKLALSPLDLVIRGGLAGAILAAATSLAFTAMVQTGQPLVGALIFPVGLIIIVLLGLELVTGSFALVPLPWLRGEASSGSRARQLGLGLSRQPDRQRRLRRAVRDRAHQYGCERADRRRSAASSPSPKPRPSATRRSASRAWSPCSSRRCCAIGWSASRVVLAMTTNSTIGKIACAWMPIFIFFAQGFEHSVVNMFIIPTGMMLGAKVTVADWWLWNQIPVTLGNLVGGFFFTGLRSTSTYKPPLPEPARMTSPAAPVPAE